MTSTSRTAQLAVPPNPGDHSRGPKSAPTTLVEYADYQCPYCREAELALKQVWENISEPVRFIFRNFPLVDSHPYALQAAAAAEAAGMQDRFWEMHDLLFEHQRALDANSLVSYARDLGLDVDRFVRDVQSDAVMQRIQDDLESGERSGVQGTPTFFLNGEMYQGNWDPRSLLSALESAGGGSS